MVEFFSYAAFFVAIGLVAFNLLIRTPETRRLLTATSAAPTEQQQQQTLAATAEPVGQCGRTVVVLRRTQWAQVGMGVLWVCLLSVQSLFGRCRSALQEPLMYVNLFGALFFGQWQWCSLWCWCLWVVLLD